MPPKTEKRPPISLGIDYGTSTIKIAWKLDHATDAAHRPSFERQGYTLPAAQAYHDNRFICGRELARMITLQSIPAASIIQYSKTAIHDESEGVLVKERSSLSQHIAEQLTTANKTLQQLLNDHMNAIVGIVQQILLGIPGFDRLGIDFDSIEVPFSARLTIPHQWTSRGRGMMSRAARTADIEPVVLASEPQCALAQYLTEISTRSTEIALCDLKKGSLVLANDLGCSTSDIVLYRLMDDRSIKSRLEAMNMSSGDRCGSQQINEKVFEYITNENRKGGKTNDDVASDLSMTSGAFRWNALYLIEEQKFKFPEKTFYPITIVSPQGEKTYTIPKHVIETAHQQVSNDVFALVHQVLSRPGQPDLQPDAVLLLGGFAQSEHLKLRFIDYFTTQRGVNVFGPKDLEIAADASLVAMGSLSDRYDKIEAQKLPTSYAYAFLLDEAYTSYRHPDCRKERVIEEETSKEDEKGDRRGNQKGGKKEGKKDSKKEARKKSLAWKWTATKPTAKHTMIRILFIR